MNTNGPTLLTSNRTTITTTTTNTTIDSSVSSSSSSRRKSHRRSKHRSRATRIVWSSDSDTSSAQDSSVLVNYLVSLSTCPSLGTRRKVPKNVKNARRRRHTHSWDVGGVCRNFPTTIDPQIIGSNSNSSTETMKTAGLGSSSGNFSQDSLDEIEDQVSLSSKEFILKQMSTSFESDSLIVPTHQVAQNFSGSFDESSDCDESDLERQLYFLQQQLFVATKIEEQVERSRSCWIDPARVVKSWSSELAGNFIGNEKVKFSYENILSPTPTTLMPICESSTSLQHFHRSSICSDQLSTYSLPEPVESAVKFLDRVRHNSTHEKFSPKPNRKKLRSDDRSISAGSSSCNFPVKTHRRSSSLSRETDGGISVGGGAGAIGVTSMWIPVTSDPSRRRIQVTSPTPSQSSFCSLPSSASVSATNLWSGNFGRISLARKVLLQHQLLPNKTEGRPKKVRHRTETDFQTPT